MIPSVASTSERRTPPPPIPYLRELCVFCVCYGWARQRLYAIPEIDLFLICRISGYQISSCRRRPIHSIPQSQRDHASSPTLESCPRAKGSERTRGSCTPCPVRPLFPTPPHVNTHAAAVQTPRHFHPYTDTHTSTLPTKKHASSFFHAPPSPSSLNPAYSVPWFAVLNRAQRLSSTTVSVAA